VVKLVLLKRPKEGVSRDELIEYLREVHGPRNAALSNVDYSLAAHVEPEDHDQLVDRDYYDSSETIPVDPSETSYDALEIHEFDTIEQLIATHTSEEGEQAEGNMSDYIDFEEEIAFVVEDVEI